ncbi:MAG: ABC transporter transmembrane domain-containing protein, partial [Alphaproteobacteria bacterium]
MTETQHSDFYKANPVKTGEEPRSSLDEAKATGRSALWSLGLFSLVINLLMLAGPLFMLQIYDRVLPSGSVPTLLVLIGLVVVLYIFLALLEMVRGRILVRLGRRLDEILYRDIFRGVFALTAKEVKGAGSQPLRDLDLIRGYIAGPGPLAFFDVPWVPIYIFLVFIFHPLLGIFAIVAAAILAVLAVLNKVLTQDAQIKATMASESAHRFAEEGRRQAGIINALGMSKALLALWAERKNKALVSLSETGDRAGLVSSISKAARLVFQSGILA